MHRCVRAEIDLDAWRHNLEVARRHAAGRQVWPVIKADAYGHGMERMARAAPADGFCVADVEEGLALRGGGITTPILVIHGAHDAEAQAAAQEADLTLVIHDEGQGNRALDHVIDRPVCYVVKMDTGMHRLGLDPMRAQEIVRRLNSRYPKASVGVMTHFGCADTPGHPLNAAQQRAFLAPAAATFISASNSAALLSGPLELETHVRPGIMLYGSSPLDGQSAAQLNLRPVMTLRSRLIAVRELPAGESVGYGATWSRPDPTRIGIVAAGYGDGFPRSAPSGTPVRVADREVELAGRVSMDSIAVDLGPDGPERVGDPVTLWGKGLDVDRIAERAGTIGYELLTRIPARVPRIEVS